MLEFIRSHLPI